ncbi:MAG TPA: cytochrome c [Vicinamibacterales bacterium]
MLNVTTAVAAAAVIVSLAAQGPPPAPQTSPAQAPPATPAAQGRGRGNPGVFPAQQRPPGDPAVVARGKALFGVTCALCHGADLRGGQLNGPNLLRSQLVLGDEAGELIMPVIRGARADKGMPPIPMPDEDAKAVVEYIHSVAALSPRQGMPPPGETPVVLDVLVGDAVAGRAYFDAKCGTCHSPAGDLQGIATRVPDAKGLQNLWVSGGSAGGRGGRGAAGGGPDAPNPRAVTVAVTLPSGERVEGRLLRIDDFFVSLTEAGGTIRSFTRTGARPRVEMHDPLEPHRALLSVYTDKDMHDVTAYLATLK